MSARLIYLASPFESPDPAVRAARAEGACRETGRLLGLGWVVFSPIAHSTGVGTVAPLPTGWADWERHCRRMLQAADEVWVLRLPGWRESVGVRAERAMAVEFGLPVRLVYPRTVCPRCGRSLAATVHGVWRHHCQGLLPTMQPYDQEAA